MSFVEQLGRSLCMLKKLPYGRCTRNEISSQSACWQWSSPHDLQANPNLPPQAEQHRGAEHIQSAEYDANMNWKCFRLRTDLEWVETQMMELGELCEAEERKSKCQKRVWAYLPDPNLGEPWLASRGARTVRSSENQAKKGRKPRPFWLDLTLRGRLYAVEIASETEMMSGCYQGYERCVES